MIRKNTEAGFTKQFGIRGCDYARECPKKVSKSRWESLGEKTGKQEDGHCFSRRCPAVSFACELRIIAWIRPMPRPSKEPHHVFENSPGLTARISCSSKDLEHVFIVPTTCAALHGHAVVVGMLLQQRQCEAIQPGEILTKTLITDA